MSLNLPNIVQAEFFLVNMTDNPDIGSILKEIFERTADDMPTKVVVRFFDIDGQINRFMMNLQRLQQKQQTIEDQFHKSRGLYRSYLSSRLQKSMRKIITLQKCSVDVARAGLVRALHLGGPVAIEPRGFNFRLLRSEEVHDTTEAVARARRAFLFLFPFNTDLIVDGIPSIAHLI